MKTQAPLFVSIPHAGELVPPEAEWLKNVPESILMCDVDRFVDRLYAPVIEKLKIPAIIGHIHRYVVDLSRLPSDIDKRTVVSAGEPSSTLPGGLHWYETTKEYILLASPITKESHNHLVGAYYYPFHQLIANEFLDFERLCYTDIYHIDLHSMPSRGEKIHRDAGSIRPDIVVSDFHGKSCWLNFRDIVIEAYGLQGFTIQYNWPYIGGGITQKYGLPEIGHHTVQVELNRALYMDENTRAIDPRLFPSTQRRLGAAMEHIFGALAGLNDGDLS